MSDVEIVLGREKYFLRPTYGAAEEICARTSLSLHVLLLWLSERKISPSDMATIVYYGMDAAGKTPTDLEAVGKRLFEAGLGSDYVRDTIAQYLIELLWAPDSAKKKEELEAHKTRAEIISATYSLPGITSVGDPRTSDEALPEDSGQSSNPSVKNPSS